MGIKNYKTKSKLFGYQIGLHNDDIYIAVPKKYFTGDNAIRVICEDEEKVYTESDHEHETSFKDKFKPENNYVIYYFKWKHYEN